MCTAVCYKNLFGRNFDFEHGFGEEICFLPRKFRLSFIKEEEMQSHNAMIGVARLEKGTPLFYDVMNEHGLCAAALNFPGNAVYFPEKQGAKNLASFEIMTYILASCSNLAEAKTMLKNVNVLNENFCPELPGTPLHWIFADRTGSIVAEPLETGLVITENPVGVLTNSPPFDYHLNNLGNYVRISPKDAENSFSEKAFFSSQSRGAGAFGLPGDYSSPSRFIKAAFVKLNSLSEGEEDISGLFHILGSVEQVKGCIRLKSGLEHTIYSSCMDMENKIYCYKTYENSRITAVLMKNENPETDYLRLWPMIKKQDMFFQDQ